MKDVAEQCGLTALAATCGAGGYVQLSLRDRKVFFFYLETVSLDKRVCGKVVAENYRVGRGSNDTWSGVVRNCETTKSFWS